MMSTRYRQALENLTEAQRKKLAERLPQSLRSGTSGSRLVAFVRVGEGYDEKSVIRSLQDKLPPPMIPSSVTTVETLPRTPNGKVDRRKLVGNVNEAIPQVSPDVQAPAMSDTERRIAKIWTEILQLEEVGVDDDFFALGGDSIQSIQMVSKSVQADLPMTMQLFVENRNVFDLARALDAVSKDPVDIALEKEQDVSALVPLMPIQHWFFDKKSPSPAHWNLECLVRIPPGTSLMTVKEALAIIIQRHEALRTAFHIVDGEWSATVLDQPDDQIVIEVESVQEAGLLHETLELESGLLFKGGFINDKSLLFLVAHHLIMDQVSWRTIVDDISQCLEGKNLSPAPNSMGHMARQLATSVKKGEWNDEITFWGNTGSVGRHRLPRDHEKEEEVVEGDMRILEMGLDISTTKRLFQLMSGRSDFGVEDLLVAGLTRTLMKWTGQNEPWRIGMEHHGRTGWKAGPEVSRSVGWFTTYYPVALPALEMDSALKDLSAVVETLDKIPNSGRGYGVLRYLGKVKELRCQPEPEVLFNYLGAIDVFKESSIETVDTGLTRSHHTPRSIILEINAFVENEALRVRWQYSRETHDRGTMIRVVSAYESEVLELLGSLGDGEERPDIEKMEEPVDSPFTENQNTILWHHLQYPDRDSGALRITFHVEGALDLAVFEEAWNMIIKRHTTLQSALLWDDGQPCRSLNRDACLHLEGTLEGDQKCDLQTAPAMRVGVRAISDQIHEVTWLCHHLFLDGWSSAIILSELMDFYDSLSGGVSRMESSGSSFHSFASWLQDDLHDSEGKNREFWCDTLRGIKGVSPFSFPDQEFHHVQQKLSFQLSGNLDTVAEKEGVPPATVFQVLLGLLLGLLEDKNETVIGVAVSGRAVPVPNMERMVGLCSNICPFRIYWNDSEPLNKLFKDVHTQKLRSLPFEHVPVRSVREWLGIDANKSLFQCLFAFGNYPLEGWQNRRLRITNYQGATTSTLPLTLTVIPGNAYKLDWLAHPDLASILPWMEANVEILIRGIIENPGITTAELLLTTTSLPNDCRDPFGTSAAALGVIRESDRVVDRVEDFILHIWEDIFGKGSVGRETTFRTVGGTSLHAAELTTRIGRRFGMRIPLDFVFKAPTVKAMADLVRGGAESVKWPIVVPIREAGNRPPLFLVHGLGGGVFNYFDWIDYLPNGLPLFALQAPLDPLGNLQDIARMYIEEMKKIQPEGPYYLGGFCFGAVVAFEMTCQLEAAKDSVEYLGVIDAGIPEFLPGVTQKARAHLSMYGWKSTALKAAKGSVRVGERLLRRLKNQGEWQQMDDVIDVDHYPEAYQKVAATHFQTLSKYRPTQKCMAPLHLIRSNSILAAADPTLGWDNVVDAIDIDVVNCEHHEIVHSDRVSEVVEKMAIQLNKAQKGIV